MVEIKQANIFGRVGEAIGKGLANTVPKEAERYRLSQGLKNLEQESSRGNLTPLQLFTKASAIPGVTPQMVQSFGELAKQQQQAGALQKYQPEQFPEIKPRTKNKTLGGEAPTLTNAEDFEKAQEGYIPPTLDQIKQRASELYNENPAFYKFDPSKAVEEAKEEAALDAEVAQARQIRHQNLTDIQDNVVKRLLAQSERLSAKGLVPSNLYDKIEDEAIQATKPKKEGGGGLTEQEAIKKFGKVLDEAARQYQSVIDLGNWGITGRKAATTLASIKNIQTDFKKRDDTENLADTLISKNKLSPKFAFALADRISDYPKLNEEFKKIKPNTFKSHLGLTNQGRLKGKIGEIHQKNMQHYEEIIPKLASSIKKGNGSPLAIAYELEKKGYDPQTWLDYVISHRDDLDLTEKQARQLSRTLPLAGTYNDWWLAAFSGVE